MNLKTRFQRARPLLINLLISGLSVVAILLAAGAGTKWN